MMIWRFGGWAACFLLQTWVVRVADQAKAICIGAVDTPVAGEFTRVGFGKTASFGNLFDLRHSKSGRKEEELD